MKNLKYLLIIYFILFGRICTAQNPHTDSLISVIETSERDTVKVIALIELSKYLSIISPDEAIQYATQAKILAEQLDFQHGAATALKYIGMGYYYQSEWVEAINFWKLSMERFESINNILGVANIQNNIASVYFNQGNKTKAIEFYLQSLQKSEQIGDKLRIVTALMNIGAVYGTEPETHDKALEFYFRSLAICEEIGYFNAIGTVTVNIGVVYLTREEADSALLYFEKSMEAYSKIQGGNIAFVLNNIGRAYSKKENYEEAIKYQNQAYEIAKKNNAKIEMAQSLLGMANTYKLMGEIKTAINYFYEARTITREFKLYFDLTNVYQGLSNSYKELSDYENAYTYQNLLISIKDTIHTAEMAKKIEAMTLNHEIDKQQGEIDIQLLIIAKQKFAKNAFLVGLILILIIAFIIFRNYLQKVKTNKLLDKKNAEIEKLLLNILPTKVAKELQDSGYSTPRHYPHVSVLFTDFKGFTKIAKGLSPVELVDEINIFFKEFDHIIVRHGLEKIKTIGDAYMCAGGVPSVDKDHIYNIIRAGLAMQTYVKDINEAKKISGTPAWDLRLGIHTGPIVAGVVGIKKYAYDIWGDTVNIASRMESSGEIGKVNISSTTYHLVKDRFNCKYRGKISAKNIGEIDMYFVESEKEAPPSQAQFSVPENQTR